MVLHFARKHHTASAPTMFTNPSADSPVNCIHRIVMLKRFNVGLLVRELTVTCMIKSSLLPCERAERHVCWAGMPWNANTVNQLDALYDSEMHAIAVE